MAEFISYKFVTLNKKEPDQLRQFWNDTRFQIGESGKELVKAIYNQFDNPDLVFDWKNNPIDFSQDISELPRDNISF